MMVDGRPKFPFMMMVDAFMVDAPRFANPATAFGLSVTILPPCPKFPRTILESPPTTLRFTTFIVLKSL